MQKSLQGHTRQQELLGGGALCLANCAINQQVFQRKNLTSFYLKAPTGFINLSLLWQNIQ